MPLLPLTLSAFTLDKKANFGLKLKLLPKKYPSPALISGKNSQKNSLVLQKNRNSIKRFQVFVFRAPNASGKLNREAILGVGIEP